MKKIFIYSAVLAMIFGGCNKDTEQEIAVEEKTDHSVIVNEMFKAGMAWVNSTRTFKSSTPVSIDVETHQFGSDGGYIHVKGSVSGEVEYDEMNRLANGSLSIDLAETIVDYTFRHNKTLYTINSLGACAVTGTVILLPGYVYDSSSVVLISGTARVTSRDGLDEILEVELSVSIMPDGSGGTVSGKINGENVEFVIGI